MKINSFVMYISCNVYTRVRNLYWIFFPLQLKEEGNNQLVFPTWNKVSWEEQSPFSMTSRSTFNAETCSQRPCRFVMPTRWLHVVPKSNWEESKEKRWKIWWKFWKNFALKIIKNPLYQWRKYLSWYFYPKLIRTIPSPGEYDCGCYSNRRNTRKWS